MTRVDVEADPPTVSVVIPMRNAEPWIVETLGSIAAQTTTVHECIVVNDGSTDEGPDLVRRFAAHAPFGVTVVDGPCTGVAAARNRGIAVATGGLIALMDADDLWHPDKIERQVDHLMATGASVSVCGYEMFPNGRQGSRWAVMHRGATETIGRWLAMEGDGLAVSSTALIRREALDSVGLFDPSFSVSADLEFMVRAATQVEVVILSEVLCEYRLHPGQMHHRTADLIHDAARLHRALEERDPRFATRCHANRYAHHGYRLLLEGDWAGGCRELFHAVRARPAAVVQIPLFAVGRRLLRYRQGRRRAVMAGA